MKKVQFTGVATATTNGNGNGKKAETIKPEVNVKVVPSAEFDHKSAVKITPHFICLSTKGVEMFTDMGDLENAKLFIDDLAMEGGGDFTTLAGLMMILDAVKRKMNDEDNRHMAEDYINWLQDYLFDWTPEATDCRQAYIDAIRSGNFVVGEMPVSKNDVWAEGIYPPKHKFGAKQPASPDVQTKILEKLDALLDTLSPAKPQIVEKTDAWRPSDESPVDLSGFEGLYLDEVWDCHWTAPNYTLVLEVQQFPGEPEPRVVNSVITKRTDGRFVLETNYLPDSAEEYPYLHEPDETKNQVQSIVPDDFDPNYDPNGGEGDTMDTLRGSMLADALAGLLANPNLPNRIYDGLAEAINELSNGRGNCRVIYDSSEYIAKVLEFHEYTEKIEAEESGIADDLALDTLTGKELAEVLPSLMNNPNLPEEIHDAIGEAVVGMSKESLESEKTEPADLASHLSAILNDPETPEKLYEVISDELSTLFDDKELTKMVDSAEFIRRALAKQAA